MSQKDWKLFCSQLKAKVALEVIRGVRTANEIEQEYGVHPTQVGVWKKELQDRAAGFFETKRGPKPVDALSSPERLYSEKGRLKMELDWLKKGPGLPRRSPSLLDRSWCDGWFACEQAVRMSGCGSFDGVRVSPGGSRTG